MFGNKENSSPASGSSNAGSGSSSMINNIVRDTEIVGSLETSSDLRIDGKLKGDINCSGKLILGVNGRVEGDVSCANAVIEGNYVGNMVVTGTLTLRDTAVLNGKIKVKKLVVSAGAAFNAQCIMTA